MSPREFEVGSKMNYVRSTDSSKNSNFRTRFEGPNWWEQVDCNWATGSTATGGCDTCAAAKSNLVGGAKDLGFDEPAAGGKAGVEFEASEEPLNEERP